MHWCETRCETGDQAFFTQQPQPHLSFGQEPASLHCLILELPATRHTTKLVIPWRRCLPTPKPWISKPSLEQFLTLALGFLHGFAIGLVARRKAYQSLSLKFLQLELSFGAARPITRSNPNAMEKCWGRNFDLGSKLRTLLLQGSQLLFQDLNVAGPAGHFSRIVQVSSGPAGRIVASENQKVAGTFKRTKTTETTSRSASGKSNGRFIPPVLGG